jgi:hypothetical protein
MQGQSRIIRAGSDWRIVDVVVRRRHIETGDCSDPYLHPLAIAATEALLPGALVTGGTLVLSLGDDTQSYLVPKHVMEWCSGFGRQPDVVMRVPVPKAFDGGALAVP